MVSYPHVDVDPLGPLGGMPLVAGVPVRHLWTMRKAGATVEEIASRFPDLGITRVLAALAFAFDNEPLMKIGSTKPFHGDVIARHSGIKRSAAHEARARRT